MIFELYSKSGPNHNTTKDIKVGEAHVHHTIKFGSSAGSIRLVTADATLQLQE